MRYLKNELSKWEREMEIGVTITRMLKTICGKRKKNCVITGYRWKDEALVWKSSIELKEVEGRETKCLRSPCKNENTRRE